jgi:hypothetical protein
MATVTESDELLAANPGGEALFEMANVRPDRSGLPFIVWISARGAARHDVRVKIAYPPRVQEFVASVSVRPDVRVVAGDMPQVDLTALARWIDLNRETLVAYWDGTIAYTEDAMAALKPLEED